MDGIDGSIALVAGAARGIGCRVRRSGRIETYDVACGNKDMTQPRPIARIVAARLQELNP